MCNDWSYCVYLYDRRMAQDEDTYHEVNTRKIGNQRPKSYLTPTSISIESIRQVLPMIPIQHFLSRLSADRRLSGTQRLMKDADIEREHAELTQRVELYDQKIKKERALETERDSIVRQSKPLKWHFLLQKYLLPVIKGIEP